MSIEAMKQALEALDLAFEKDLTYLSDHAMIARQDVVRSRLAITALRAAIAEESGQDVQQEMDCYGDGNVYRGQRSSDSQVQTIYVQEPVAWRYKIIPPGWTYSEEKPNRDFAGSAWDKWQVTPLYTHPPRSEWVGLTDEEVGGLTVFDGLTHIEVPILAEFVRTIEAKLKEKNGG